VGAHVFWLPWHPISWTLLGRIVDGAIAEVRAWPRATRDSRVKPQSERRQALRMMPDGVIFGEEGL